MGAKQRRVERSIKELIASGQLGPGGRLPSERQLAEQLEAGRTTIRLVLMKLATEGIVRNEHGRGYFVTGANDGAAEPASDTTLSERILGPLCRKSGRIMPAAVCPAGKALTH